MSLLADPLFLTTTGGIVIGIIGLILRYCYKLKCEEISVCCGLLKFHRNINNEMNIDLQNIQLQQKNPPYRLSTATS